MPLYVYKCGECEHTFEEKNSIKEYKKPCSEPCRSCNAKDTVSIQVQPVTTAWGSSTGMTTDQSFNDRLKEMKKNISQEGETISHNIR